MENNNQIITVINGESVTLNGVANIVGFDENSVIMDTSGGRIIVEGDSLKIESLEKERGDVLIKGNICGVFRSDNSNDKKGFFGRIFGK